MNFSNEYEMACSLVEIRDALKELGENVSQLEIALSIGIAEIVDAIKETE